MYAIVVDRGKQYKVQEGDTVQLDLMERETGDTFDFEKVVLFKKEDEVKVGTPSVDGVTVTAKVVTPVVKGKKIIVYKFRRRKDSRTKNGHRQRFTRVQIEKIAAS